MNKNKILPGIALVLFTLGFSSFLHAGPVEIKLALSVDGNCDGSINATDTTAKAIPGACIIYTMTTTNNGKVPVHNLQINGQIPEHTRLYKQLWLDNDVFAYKSTQIDNINRLIKIHVGQLNTGEKNAIVLQYAVKID